MVRGLLSSFSKHQLNLLSNIMLIQYVEKRTRESEGVATFTESVQDVGQGVGYCIDLMPDKTVGVAMDRVLVGSQDVAHDFDKLKECGVTHVLNVAYGIANIFTDVSS